MEHLGTDHKNTVNKIHQLILNNVGWWVLTPHQPSRPVQRKQAVMCRKSASVQLPDNHASRQTHITYFASWIRLASSDKTKGAHGLHT